MIQRTWSPLIVVRVGPEQCPLRRVELAADLLLFSLLKALVHRGVLGALSFLVAIGSIYSVLAGFFSSRGSLLQLIDQRVLVDDNNDKIDGVGSFLLNMIGQWWSMTFRSGGHHVLD